MNYLFWICWIAEMTGIIWWIISDLRLTYLEPNPYSYLGGFYLLLALVIRYGLESTAISNAMIFIPGIPLFLYALMILLFMSSGKKWN